MTRLVNVRPAYDDELDDIRELDLQCFPSDYPADFTDAVEWFVAVRKLSDGDQILGYAGCKPSDMYADAWYLSRVGVHSAHRGRHLQRRLIRACDDWARKQGALCMVTDTAPWNVASIRNFHGAGYKVFWPDHPAMPWAGDTAVYLAKWFVLPEAA